MPISEGFDNEHLHPNAPYRRNILKHLDMLRELQKRGKSTRSGFDHPHRLEQLLPKNTQRFHPYFRYTLDVKDVYGLLGTNVFS
jgi:hypothetical protein